MEAPIVLDGGTGFLKVGYAAQNFPEHQFPSIVGRPILRSEEQAGDIVVKDIMCGDEAAAARSMLQITYPVRQPHTILPIQADDPSIDGEWHRQEVGRHATPVGLYVSRETQGRYHRPKDPSYRTAHEPTQKP